ncbi:MAG TPA: carbohydrate kinase family protein [Segeticoccus sp.]|nr:carbohydrate kinase family protein [Segeticoccus sp.]
MPSAPASQPRPGGYAVVVGGANVDVKARSLVEPVSGTSNPGRTVVSSGGVGRNVAENLARLGTPTHLVAVVGRDRLGADLLEHTREAGVDVSAVTADADRTGTYTAVLDHAGELLVAVSDMVASDAMPPSAVDRVRPLLAGAGLVVADGNLPADTLAHLLDACTELGVACLLDPVSVPKAARLAPRLRTGRPVFAVTPNADELTALAALPPTSGDSHGPRGSAADLGSPVAALHDRGATHVWVRLGPRGSVLASPGREPVHLSSAAVPVQDVTGAGDAMLAAFAHGLLRGLDPLDAAREGHRAAALTVQSPHTVRPDLAEAMAAAVSADDADPSTPTIERTP